MILAQSNAKQVGQLVIEVVWDAMKKPGVRPRVFTFSHRGLCAFLAGFERVFHPLHHGIELTPLGSGIGDGQDVHNAISAGEHHLLIINLISAIAAENEPRAPAGLIGNLLITSSVFDHPTLEMFWSPIISIIPGTDKKLSIHRIGREIMEARFAVALYRSEQCIGKGIAKSELGIPLISPRLACG